MSLKLFSVLFNLSMLAAVWIVESKSDRESGEAAMSDGVFTIILAFIWFVVDLGLLVHWILN